MGTREEKINNLFLSDHRYSNERFKWLCMWLGDNDNMENNVLFESRLKFLQNVWGEKLFRPFETIESSVDFLTQKPNEKFLIRLSTREPGHITVSYNIKDRGVRHIRFTISNSGNIIDADHNEHNSLLLFSNYLSKFLSHLLSVDYKKYRYQVEGYEIKIETI